MHSQQHVAFREECELFAEPPIQSAIGSLPSGEPSYYRARYYDPAPGRFLSEDPLEFAGGNSFYVYALNRPTNFVDPVGFDGHTWGPFTFYTNQQGMSPTQIKAEQAHERQHRCDFWNGNVFTKPCEFLESRGFAAEIPVLQQRIDDLRKQKTLTTAERHELQELLEEFSTAQGMSDPKGAMIHYYCNPPGTSTSPTVNDYNGFPPPWAVK